MHFTALFVPFFFGAITLAVPCPIPTGNLTIFNECSNVRYSLDDGPWTILADPASGSTEAPGSTPALVLPLEQSGVLRLDSDGPGNPGDAILNVSFSEDSQAGTVTYGINWVSGSWYGQGISGLLEPYGDVPSSSDYDCETLEDEDGGHSTCDASSGLALNLCNWE